MRRPINVVARVMVSMRESVFIALMIVEGAQKPHRQRTEKNKSGLSPKD